MKKIIILGAGVVGVTSAYFLAEKGYQVTVLEAKSSAGQGTSRANGAQLSYSKTFPLSNPKTLKKLPFYLFSKDSPMHIHAGFDLAFYKWGLQFLAESTNKKAHNNNDKVVKLALKSKAALQHVLERSKIEFDFNQRGKMYIYTSEESYAAAAAYVDGQNAYGFDWRFMDIDEAVAKEPSLAHIKDKLVGVSYCPIDESGDAYKFTLELAKTCEKMGVKFVYDAPVTDFKREKGRVKSVLAGGQEYEADDFICCLGVYSPIVMKKLGISVPIYPMKGYSITVPATVKAPKINITDDGKRIVYSTIGGRLRVAGIAEFGGYNYEIDRKIMDRLIDDAATTMPDAGDFSKVEEWTGLRPMTPSTVPIIKKAGKYENLYLNTGQGMLGWTLACGSAQELAELVG